MDTAQCTKYTNAETFHLLLAYAVDSAQPLSSGIRSGMESQKSTLELVHWTVVHDV